jgi:hypothetical protein
MLHATKGIPRGNSAGGGERLFMAPFPHTGILDISRCEKRERISVTWSP